jgi:hypothetical protein
MSLASLALSLLAGGKHALWAMLLQLAGFRKTTLGETAGEIIFCCPAHLKYLFAEGRASLFCFIVSANFRERLNSRPVPTQRWVTSSRNCEVKARAIEAEFQWLGLIVEFD